MDATSCTLQWIYRAYLRETKEIRQPMHFLSHYILIKPIVWPGHPLSHWQNEIMGTPFLSKIALIQANLDWSVMVQASGTYICIDAIVEKGNERKRARGKEGKKDLEMKICVFTYQSANKLLAASKGQSLLNGCMIAQQPMLTSYRLLYEMVLTNRRRATDRTFTLLGTSINRF